MPIKDIRQEKRRIREKCRQLRNDMPPRRKQSSDAVIQRMLCGLRQYKRSKAVFVYVSKNIEVDTHAFIRRALRDGKAVAVPRCVPDTRKMEFYYINSLEELEPGAFGVLEPVPERQKQAVDYSNALCIVPGLCFDVQGYRLGYGKGYYDRFMGSFEGFSVGLCYSDCVQWRLPHGQFDRSVDLLLTERYMRYTARYARVTAE